MASDICNNSNQKAVPVLAVLLVTATSAITTTLASGAVRFVPTRLQLASNCISENSDTITNSLPGSYSAMHPSLTVRDIIISSQDILGIGKLHLAKIFKMSRQNLDNLLKKPDQKPTQETEERAWQIKKALDLIAEHCPYKLGASTITCKINNRNLLVALSEDVTDFEEIKMFSREISRRIQTNLESNLPEKVKRNQEFMDTFNAV